MGPPHMHIFRALLLNLSKRRAEIGEANADNIDEFLRSLSTMDREQYLDKCRVCRLVKCYDRSKMRLLLAVERTGLHDNLLASFSKIGAKALQGMAPPGALERVLGDLLEVTAGD